MDVTHALNSRFTCRAFKPDQLGRDTLLDILTAANWTPSWANTQPWEIFVCGGATLEELRQECLENFRRGVKGASDLARPEKWPAVIDERIRNLFSSRFREMGIDRDDQEHRKASAENNHRFFGAPVVVYLCIDHSLTPWSIHDLGMMSQSIMLAAEERGVASAIAYNLVVYPGLIRKALDIPDELDIIIGIALGYADMEDSRNSFRSPRRPLEDVVRLRGI